MPKSNQAKWQELKALNEAIDTRKKYHAEQEALISDTVERGNGQLKDLTYDIQLAKKQLHDLKTEVRTAAQDKVLLLQDLERIRDDIHSARAVEQPTYPVLRPLMASH